MGDFVFYGIFLFQAHAYLMHYLLSLQVVVCDRSWRKQAGNCGGGEPGNPFCSRDVETEEMHKSKKTSTITYQSLIALKGNKE